MSKQSCFFHELHSPSFVKIMLVVMISLLHSKFCTLLNHVYSLDHYIFSNWYICAMLAIPRLSFEWFSSSTIRLYLLTSIRSFLPVWTVLKKYIENMSKIHGDFSAKFKELCHELNTFKTDSTSKTNKMASYLPITLYRSIYLLYLIPTSFHITMP